MTSRARSAKLTFSRAMYALTDLGITGGGLCRKKGKKTLKGSKPRTGREREASAMGHEEAAQRKSDRPATERRRRQGASVTSPYQRRG